MAVRPARGRGPGARLATCSRPATASAPSGPATSTTSWPWPGLDPVVNVFVDYRARTTNLEPRWLGGEMWGRFEGGRLRAACHVGANLVPVQATRRGRRGVRRAGPDPGSHGLHDRRAAGGRGGLLGGRRRQLGHARARPAGTSRTCRSTARPPSRPTRWCAAPRARTWPSSTPPAWRCTPRRSGVSPEAGGGAELYRARVTQLMNRGWSFARFDDGRLVFKAEVACATPYAAQVQGVWVPPDRRGEGLAAAGMAAVVELVRRRDRAGRLALRQRLERRRPAHLRAGPGSARPRASPPSCSDAAGASDWTIPVSPVGACVWWP